MNFRGALRSNEVVQHLFDFFHGEVEARSCVGKTERAIHVANAIYLDDSEASVLLVVRTKPQSWGQPSRNFGAVKPAVWRRAC